MKSEKYAARFVVYSASDMTQQGKKNIANWLRNQAKLLVRDGGKYAKRFTARYYYK